MSGDFLHCKGENCHLKHICLRYEAHKYTEAKKHWNAYYFEPHKVGNDCEAFVKKQSNER